MTDLRPVPLELVKREEMAAILSVSVATFDRMRRDGRAAGRPCPERTWGRALCRFEPVEVLRWASSLETKKKAA